MDILSARGYTLSVMLNRCYRYQESLVRYWTQRAVDLCIDIEDDSLQEHVVPVQEALAAMERERRVVFFGAKGSGKTALLSRVAGCSVMAHAAWESPYIRWRYRCEDGNAENSRFIPDPSLDGLELIDSRACDSPEMAETLRNLLPGADVAVAVVDARSYEQSPVWDILAALPENSVGVTMVALTFTDSLSAEATLALSAAMREFSKSRLGVSLPAYAVNPASDTAVESFTTRVQEALAAPGGVRAAIRRVLNTCVDLMYKQGSVLKTREDIARTDSGFLAGIEQEIDNFLSHQMQGVKPCIDIYSESVNRVRPRLMTRLHRAFGWFLSPVTLLRLELYGAGVEKSFYHLMKGDIGRLQQESDERFTLSCGGHWRSVRPRMKKTLECEIGEFPEAQLKKELDKLRVNLENELHVPIRQARFRTSLSGSFKARAGWMRGFIIAICITLILAGVLGFLGQDAPALACVALAAILWLIGSAAHWVAFRRLSREIGAQTAELYKGVNDMLVSSVETLLISRVAAYRRLYTEPRKKVARHEAQLKPLQEAHGEIYRQLRGAAPRI